MRFRSGPGWASRSPPSRSTRRRWSRQLRSSLEALKAYSAGKIAIYARGGPAAIPHLQQAIAIDPQFAMAHADLGFMLWNMGQTDLGAEQIRIAYGLRDRVSDRERRYILCFTTGR